MAVSQMKKPLRGYEEMPSGIMKNSLREYEEGSFGAYASIVQPLLIAPAQRVLLHTPAGRSSYRLCRFFIAGRQHSFFITQTRRSL